MLLFLFLLVITRVYAPFDQSLGADRGDVRIPGVGRPHEWRSMIPPLQKAQKLFRPQGHDIVFEHVGFAYDEKEVLHDVSFTAKEGESDGAGRPLRLGQEHLRPAGRQIVGCHQRLPSR